MVIASATVSLGPDWLTVAVAIVLGMPALALAWNVARGGGGSAVSVLREANTVLAGRVHELESRVKQQDEVIAALRAKTDLTVALLPIGDRIEQHELEAKKRSDATLKVLERIAAMLDGGAAAA